MSEFLKIFSISSSATLLPEIPENRFQPLTFAKHFERQTLWNALEQRTSPCLNTGLKVLFIIPLFLIEKIALATQELGNSAISPSNYLFSKRTVSVVTPTIDELSAEEKSILDDSKKNASKTEIASPSQRDLERVKVSFANIIEPSRRLTYAASMGYLEGVKIALHDPETNINYQSYMSRNDFGSTALMGAALEGHKEIVELLLQAGADPNIIDPSRMSDCELSIVDRVFKNGATALMKATLGRNRTNNAGNKEIVELLLNAKADPDIQDLRGNTALILAAEHCKAEIVELLLNNGANPNIKTFAKDMVTFRSQNDWTALMNAARKGHKEIVRLLLDAKADPNIQSKSGNTALILATDLDIIRLLLKAGVNPNIQNEAGVGILIKSAKNGRIDIVKELIDVNADLNVKNSAGDTPLILAAAQGHKEIVELLINAKADLNVQNQFGETALTWAAFQGHTDIVKILIEAKANLNIQNQFGSTSLMLAADKRHKEVVKLLLDAGADSNIKDNDGRTVLSRLRFAYQADDVLQLIKSFDHTF